MKDNFELKEKGFIRVEIRHDAKLFYEICNFIREKYGNEFEIIKSTHHVSENYTHLTIVEVLNTKGNK